MFNSSNVGFLALHLGIDDTCEITYNVQAKRRTPQNLSDLQQALSIAGNLFGGTAVYKSLTNLVPAPGAAATSIPSGQMASMQSLNTEDIKKLPSGVGIFGFAAFRGIERLPFDLTITGKVNRKTLVSGTLHASSSFLAVDGNAEKLEAVKRPTADSFEKSVKWETEEVPITCDASASFLGSSNDGQSRFDDAQSLPPTAYLVQVNTDRATGQTGSSKGTERPTTGSGGQGASDPQSGTPPDDSLKKTYSDDGPYRWDVSFGIPVKTAARVGYNANDGTVRSTKSLPINPYLFFDYFPIRADLVKPPSVRWPSISAGIPLSNQPFNRATIGTSLGINVLGIRISPFAGVLLLREFRPDTLHEGSRATNAQLHSDLVPTHHYRLLLSVNFSTRDAVSVLKNQATGNKETSPTSQKGTSGTSAGGKTTGSE